MPTSEAIKFKAKAWIDVFGARSAKALGSTITNTAKNNPDLLVHYGSVPSLLISLALMGISILVGKQFEDLLASGEYVGVEETTDFIEHNGRRMYKLNDIELTSGGPTDDV